MRPLDQLGAGDVKAVVAAYRDALKAHRQAINRLNVYPVPDGDTGTNMALTLDSVVSELDDAGPGMDSVCEAIAHGSLMGARGNSGVILSQILRGLTSVMREVERVDGPTLARALRAATEGAYRAVGRPVEGTILTVVREAADAAEAAAAIGGDAGDAGDAGSTGGATLVGVLEAAQAEGAASLARTPELLDVLRQAGVVDAGGAGLLLLFDAALSVVAGRPVPEVSEVAVEGPTPATTTSSPAETELASGGPRYEVMFLLEAPDDAVDGLRLTWNAIGDSIAVVGGEGLWNCHIHTDDIGAAVEAGIEAGRPRKIRVTDLTGEVQEQRWVTEASGAAPAPATGGTAVVAVATGAGLHRLFRSLGAIQVVGGGQSMNPSTAQLLAAVDATGADEVVVLPNNGNILAVANQLDGLSLRSVRVVPTRAIPEGLAALLALDPGAGAEDNAKAMADAANGVVVGEVARAVRDSSCAAGPITAGDWLGLGPDGIQALAPGPAEAATALLDALVDEGHELVTIIEGEDAEAEDTARLVAWLGEHRAGVEVEVHAGGQPLYPYLFGIE